MNRSTWSKKLAALVLIVMFLLCGASLGRFDSLHQAVERDRLCRAASMGDMGVAEDCLRRGVSCDGPIGRSPLYAALLGVQPKMARLLLDHGAVLEPGDSPQVSPLCIASASNPRAADAVRAELVDLLLARGARVDAVGMRGRTALMLAAESGAMETVRVLLAHNASRDITTPTGESAATLAEAEGHVAIAELLRGN